MRRSSSVMFLFFKKDSLLKGELKMNYFKYQPQGQMGEIWSLFADLRDAQVECLEKKDSINRCEYSHTYQILSSAMNGTIFDLERFNLREYEYACQERDKIIAYNKSKKELSIVDDELSEDGDAKKSPNTINVSKLKRFEEAFQLVIENEDFENCLRELLNIREDYVEEKGFDPILMLKNALMGIPDAVKGLREVKDKRFQELVSSLCELGGEGTLMLRLSEVV